MTLGSLNAQDQFGMMSDDPIVSAYPIPASNVLTVTLDPGVVTSSTVIQLIDSIGKEVEEIILDRFKPVIQIDVNSVPSGLYYLRIIVAGEVLQVKKVSVLH
ncbi:T9SS type A sorting domain-containing protein [Chitinophagales bacterium]|nr:T9SS type A sorting domain-containing protein [Chitinophagales bacterium]